MSVRLDDLGSGGFDGAPVRCVSATPVASWLHTAGTSEVIHAGAVEGNILPSDPIRAQIHSTVQGERYSYALFVNSGMPRQSWSGASLSDVVSASDQVATATVTRLAGDAWATRFVRFQGRWVLSEASVSGEGWHSTLRLLGYHYQAGLVLPAEAIVTMVPPGATTDIKIDRYFLLNVTACTSAEVRSRFMAPINDVGDQSVIRVERRIAGSSQTVFVRDSGESLPVDPLAPGG